MTDFETTLESAPQRLAIVDTLLKARAVLGRHRRIAVSISGGSDSDTMLDLIELVKPGNCEVAYAFFNTGLEYKAALRHLDDLEQEYGVRIERRRPRKPIPIACREYGVPFISKDASEMLSRLQKHNFDWSDAPEEATPEKYGKCKSALDWYFDRRPPSASGKRKFSIGRYRLLREFIQANPPGFPVSDKCCDYAKKLVAKDFNAEFCPDIVVTGMRRAEGGRRAGSISTCFTPGSCDSPDSYRPLWYWSDDDKAAYKEWRGIRYSDCYEVYGLKRTGCVGCPCNSRAERELELVEAFEPGLAKAARAVFGASYEYRRRYAEFKNGQP
jgi:3'-phosphoadenosine 5'-phosphosulfate sulfotransferase (PAPS reductase)/FAD synthetase